MKYNIGLLIGLVFTVLALPNCGLAQGNVGELAILKMIDGSSYQGTVIKERSGEVELQIITGDTITAKNAFIKRYMAYDRYLVYKNGQYHKKKGFYWQLDWGSNVLANSNFEVSSVVAIEFGYHFNERVSLGGGLASEFHDVNTAGFFNSAQVNIAYLNAKYFVFNTRKRFFVHGRLGAGRAIDSNFRNDNKAGVNAQYGVGVHFASRRKGKFFLSLSMMNQNITGEEFFIDDFGNEVFTSYDVWINRPLLKIGVVFN